MRGRGRVGVVVDTRPMTNHTAGQGAAMSGERLVGRVGEVLAARFARLSEVEANSLCVHQGLGDALRATIDRLHGVQAVMVSEPNYTANHGFESHRVYYLLDEVPDKVLINGNPAEPGRVATVAFDDTNETVWRRTFLTHTPEAGQMMRREALGDHLKRAMVLKHAVTERLGLPYPVGIVEATRWADQYGALLVWWQSRRAQGYDPEAAATMLALICHPSVYAKVAFPDGSAGEGGAPTLAAPEN